MSWSDRYVCGDQILGARHEHWIWSKKLPSFCNMLRGAGMLTDDYVEQFACSPSGSRASSDENCA